MFSFVSSHFLTRRRNTRLATLGLLAVVLSARAFSQTTPKPESQPEPSTAPVALVAAPVHDPVVHPDGSATFRLEMPNAKDVKLSLENVAEPYPMVRNEAGAWSVTVPPLDPEYHAYNFRVDGTEMIDPLNVAVKTSFFHDDSLFLVPGHPARPWEVQDVPHGIVHHHLYHSAIVLTESEYYVYTPPGFDPAAHQTYPVLYLLHGYSDDASAWTAMAKANIILDNLIAQGKAKPMIVVMPLGYGSMEMITRGWVAWRDIALVRRNFLEFGHALYAEVMPRVAKQYPISTNREDHAIAGLSMGGAESLLVGLNHTDDFAYVGGFSAGGLGSGPFDLIFPAVTDATGPAIDHTLRLLWVSCGSEDGLLGPNQKLIAFLKERKLNPKVIVTPGMHVWPVWRDNLSNFLPLLFQGH